MNNQKSSSGWLICFGGLLIFLSVQGVLLNRPLANWTLLPELDDSLTYVLKTRQMQECRSQPCPALLDLAQQVNSPGPGPAAARENALVASRIFPIYHPLFSLILLALAKTGLGLLEAYQWLWRFAPVIFGLAFAYLLIELTGPAAAGIALALLACKIFPDTGLHHLVPSNFTMAMAVAVWARIISRQGWAPWSLGLSAFLLPALHPVGVLYTMVSIGLALTLTKPPHRQKVWFVISFMVLIIGILFITSWWVRGVPLVYFNIIPPVPNPLAYILTGAGQNLQSIIVAVVRSDGSLFGQAGVFLAAVVLGLLSLPTGPRRVNATILLLNILLLFVMLFYVSSHPGDVILRLWIPLVVILFGLVGHAFMYVSRLSKGFLENWRPLQDFNLTKGLPLLVLAVLVGYSCQMAATGGEQIITYVDFLRKRQPLVFNPEQPRMLLSQAQPGDQVFYNSLIIMPYFFINGTLRLGAVYYHPALQGSPVLEDRLQNENLRYAVTYNPTVYHPSFAGREESNWWITSPNFRYSPLDKRRRFGPLAQEGKISVQDYKWLEIASDQENLPTVLKLHLKNPGEISSLSLVPINSQGEMGTPRITTIPAHWDGWLKLDPADTPARRFRLIFPADASQGQISGLVFGDEPHNWPWTQRATLTAKPRETGAPEITVSFDPQKMLPPPLNQRHITILDDSGSSVLFELK